MQGNDMEEEVHNELMEMKWTVTIHHNETTGLI